MTHLTTASSQPALAAPAGNLTLVHTAPSAVPGTRRHEGRRRGTYTSRGALIATIHQGIATELQVPLAVIARYDAASWSLAMSRLTSAAIARLMARLQATLPHPVFGTLAQVPRSDRDKAGTWIDAEGSLG